MRLQKTLPYQDIERQVRKILVDTLFVPILATIKAEVPESSASFLNADETPLRNALRNGSVQFDDGVFSGTFQATISKEIRAVGGVFDKRAGVYRLAVGKCPSWILAEASAFREKAKKVHASLVKKIGEIEKDLDKTIEDSSISYDKTVASLDDGFRGVAKSLEINPTMSEEARRKISETYSNNMKLFIKKFSKSQIVALRETVEKNAFEGYRFSALQTGLEHNYGVTKNKAKFLARNETSIFMSKFREERFSEAGIKKYQWSTSHDSRVRDDHKHLDGKTFFFSSPPIVDKATGARANPGEWYQCRCVAIPVIVNKGKYEYD
jgi:SPP1 gp7 family putative phage head morphogenesis protein